MSVPISSKEWLNIDELIEKMWETLDLVRVYTKARSFRNAMRAMYI
jgi:ribosome-interacting GTPase 1